MSNSGVPSFNFAQFVLPVNDNVPALTVVGHDGLLFLDDPPPRARFRIRHDGGYCEVMLPEVRESAGFVELEGVVCR